MVYVADAQFMQQPRVAYAWQYLVPDAVLCTNVVQWQAHNGPKIWYATTPPPAKALHIQPAARELWLEGIPPLATPFLLPWAAETVPVLYASRGHLGFDPVAACFFMLSRAAEYHTSENSHDAMGRYKGHASLQRLYKHPIPVVDLWRHILYAALQALSFSASVPDEFKYQGLRLSMDIDNWYAFKQKPVGVQMGGSVRDLFKFGPAQVLKRMSTWLGKADPFDPAHSLRWLAALHEGNNIEGHSFTAFVLAAQTRSTYNKNLPVHTLPIQELEAQYPWVRWAWHPSVVDLSLSDDEVLKTWQQEYTALKAQHPALIAESRFHYLAFQLPRHYRLLLKLGIKADHSMLFARQAGWRAGMAYPFRWYDLEADAATDLEVHPALTMDTRLAERFRKAPADAIHWLKKKFGTRAATMPTPCLPLVLHNESLSGYGPWKGFGQLLPLLNAWQKELTGR